MAFLAGFAPSLPDEPAGAAGPDDPVSELDPESDPEPPSELDEDPESEGDDESDEPSLLPDEPGFGEE